MNPAAAGLELQAQVHRAGVGRVHRTRSASAFCQMLHGHCGPAVVKLQENGLLIGVPEVFCAPDTVAV